MDAVALRLRKRNRRFTARKAARKSPYDGGNDDGDGDDSFASLRAEQRTLRKELSQRERKAVRDELQRGRWRVLL
jgi:hypothetical protein